MPMQQDKTPAVSVLMGVRYRRADTVMLQRAVESILNQTFSDFELLICDGGSSAEACCLLDSLALSDSRIRLVRGENLPEDLAGKLNTCLDHARGELIARMDDDDFSHPERFERQVSFLLNHGDIAFVGCSVSFLTDGVQTGTKVFPEYPQVRDFYFTQPFVHPTLMFRRSVLTATGGYSTGKHQVLCEDYDLLLRLYTMGHSGANLQDILFDYTVSLNTRKMKHRWNEAVTRWNRFKDLNLLPRALPYVIKPLAVGLIPRSLLARIKKWR